MGEQASSPQSAGRPWRSAGAVLAGVSLIIFLSLGTDILMHATGVFPPWFQPMSTPLWLLALGYRIVYGIAGGYLTARLAPRRPVFHAIVLGAIGVALSFAGVASTWDKGPEFGPKWYSIALILIALPCSWWGGKIREQQLKSDR